LRIFGDRNRQVSYSPAGVAGEPAVAARADTIEAARDEAEADHEKGVRRRVLAIQRHALSVALVVRKDERKEQVDGAKAIAVIARQFVRIALFCAQRLHLRAILVQTSLNQTRNPEHE